MDNNYNYKLEVEISSFEAKKEYVKGLYKKYGKKYRKDVDEHLKRVIYYLTYSAFMDTSIKLSINNQRALRTLLEILHKEIILDFVVAKRNKNKELSRFKASDNFHLLAENEYSFKTGKAYPAGVVNIFEIDNSAKKPIIMVGDVRDRYDIPVVEEYNKMMDNVKITYDNFRLETTLKRSFKHIDFNQHRRDDGVVEYLCGRLYAYGVSHLNIKKAKRNNIKINGNETVELDYTALHPSILYCKSGLPIPKDMYEVAGLPRKLVKKAFISILASDRRQYVLRKLSLDLKITFKEADAILKKIEEKHKPISKYFYTYQAPELQKADSDMMMRIIKQSLKDGVIVLPIHDGLMVEEKNLKWANDMMHKVFKEKYNVDIEVKVGGGVVVKQEATMINMNEFEGFPGYNGKDEKKVEKPQFKDVEADADILAEFDDDEPRQFYGYVDPVLKEFENEKENRWAVDEEILSEF